MDSDDEFMSGTSSHEGEFGDAEDSDDGSFGEGIRRNLHLPLLLLRLIHFRLIDFDDAEPDVGFPHEKDIIRPTKRSYEVDFKVFEPSDIQAHQDKQINEVSAILQQPPEASAILLRHARWNKERLIETYMEKPDELLEAAGLGADTAQVAKTKVIDGFTCDICCEDEPCLETYALKCGHRYCVDCYRQYLVQKIKEEGEAARIQCPTSRCHRIVDSKSLDLLVASELKDR